MNRPFWSPILAVWRTPNGPPMGPDGLQFAEPVEFMIASDRSPVPGDSLVVERGPLLTGDIDLATGAFTATTGRVDISQDQEAEETYENGHFQVGDADQNTSFTATSRFIIYDEETGDEVCRLSLAVSGEKP